jgi:hypothetical protein
MRSRNDAVQSRADASHGDPVKRFAFALLLVPSIAFADAASDEADKKFNEAVKAMDDGKYDVACPLFAESYRLDPMPGALFTLAECESKWGKMATALGHYEQFLQLYEKMTGPQKTKSASRAKLASSQIEALGPEVPELSLSLPATAPNDVVVKRDNVVVPLDQLSKAARLDPGEHVFVVETTDGRSKETKVKVAVGEKRKLELQVPEGKKDDGSKPDIFQSDTSSKKSGGSLMPVTITVGVIGLAGVAVGAVTGVLALGDKSTADQNCMGLGCNQKGIDAVKNGQTMGWVSTVGFIAGGVCLAVAVVLFAMEPKKQKTGFVAPSLQFRF